MKLDVEIIDEITVHNLKDVVKFIVTSGEGSDILEPMLEVLEYFYGHSNTQFFKQDLGIVTSDEIVVEGIADNPDGSCNVTFSTSQRTIRTLAEAGFTYLLIKSITGISDDAQIMRKLAK
jgi:hypothetical protein